MPDDQERERRKQARKAAGLARNSEMEAARQAASPPSRLRQAAFLVAYACFDCRKSFKRRFLPDTDVKCPDCGQPSAEMGRSFKPPRKSEIDQWTKVARLWRAGYRFHTNTRGADIPPYPGHLRDVDAFIADNPRHPFRLRAYWPQGGTGRR